MADVSPNAVKAARKALGIADDHIPRSVAIIMDGNGRWARRNDLPRSEGHLKGAEVVWHIVTEAARLGLDALTLYSFSTENWSRPRDEVNMLMHLYAKYLFRERGTVMAHNIRLRHLGRRDGLPENVLRELDESIRVSRNNTGMDLALALNYSSRVEMTDAVTRIARKVAQGQLEPDRIDQKLISDNLDTTGMPDPDLLIRTSGEMRLSNYLLWQLSYAEFYITDEYWPDFDEKQFQKAILNFASRHRRFGGVDESNR